MQDSKSFSLPFEKYTARVEYTQGVVILHLSEIENFTKEAFIDMQGHLWDFVEFCNVQCIQVYCACPIKDPKISRLAHKLGFHPIGSDKDYFIFQYGEQ